MILLNIQECHDRLESHADASVVVGASASRRSPTTKAKVQAVAMSNISIHH